MIQPPSPLPQRCASAPLRAGRAMPWPAAATAALLLAAALGGCGQKGPLFIPDTPAAAQRATLPQTLFGGGKTSDTGVQDEPSPQQRPDDDQPPVAAEPKGGDEP